MDIEGVEYFDDFLIRKEEFGNTLIFVDDSFENNNLKKSVKSYIQENSIRSFEINSAFCESKIYYDFIYQFQKIKRIRIITIDSLGIDFSNPSFCELSVLISNRNTENINFSNLEMLEELDIKWADGRKGFLNCSKLKKIVLHGFNGKNLNEFRQLSLLESLELISSSIENLEGIENLSGIKKIELHYCRKLNNLSNLNTLKNLEILILGNLSALNSLSFVKNLNQLTGFSVRDCKKLVSSDDVLHLNNLTFLGINNAGVLTSLKPIVNFKKLKRLTLGQTKILDGDVSPILKLKSIEYIQFADSKNFNYKLIEIRKIMNVE